MTPDKMGTPRDRIDGFVLGEKKNELKDQASIPNLVPN